MNKIMDIKGLNFIKIGKWEINDTKIRFDGLKESDPTEEVKNILDNEQYGVLYAFVINNEVKYIGSTKRKPKERFRVHCQEKNILTMLKDKKEVFVFAYSPTNENNPEDKEALHKTLKLNIALGLEHLLISKFSESELWNKGKTYPPRSPSTHSE